MLNGLEWDLGGKQPRPLVAFYWIAPHLTLLGRSYTYDSVWQLNLYVCSWVMLVPRGRWSYFFFQNKSHRLNSLKSVEFCCEQIERDLTQIDWIPWMCLSPFSPPQSFKHVFFFEAVLKLLHLVSWSAVWLKACHLTHFVKAQLEFSKAHRWLTHCRIAHSQSEKLQVWSSPAPSLINPKCFELLCLHLSVSVFSHKIRD